MKSMNEIERDFAIILASDIGKYAREAERLSGDGYASYVNRAGCCRDVGELAHIRDEIMGIVSDLKDEHREERRKWWDENGFAVLIAAVFCGAWLAWWVL